MVWCGIALQFEVAEILAQWENALGVTSSCNEPIMMIVIESKSMLSMLPMPLEI